MKKDIQELKVIVTNPKTTEEAKHTIERINEFLAFKYQYQKKDL